MINDSEFTLDLNPMDISSDLLEGAKPVRQDKI